MTDPKTPEVVAPLAAPKPVVVEKAKKHLSLADGGPETVKVIANLNPIPHAYKPEIRISNVAPTIVPNDGWTEVQLNAGVIRLAE